MALKKPIRGGSDYCVSFQASSQTQGTTLLTVGWVAQEGGKVPGVAFKTIAPAATDELRGKVPTSEAARWIEIRVDLPDGKGWGTLSLKTGDEVHATDQLSRDTVWVCIVQ